MSCAHILLSCLILLTLAVPARASEAMLVLDGGTDVTASASVDLGGRVVLDVRNPGSGGYVLADPVYDRAILALTGRGDIRPGSGLAGDFGRVRFEFKAVGAGETEVLIRAFRPWEQGKDAEVFVRARVSVH